MKAKSKGDEALKQAREVLKIEAECILGLIPKLDQNFSKAVETIYRSKGRVIVSGIGKSGLIGRKIVATFTSTGTPAIFLHPVEGMHGDLGIVTKGDVLIAISNSGETAELNELIARIGPIGLPLIALTGNPKSTLGRSERHRHRCGRGQGGLSLRPGAHLQHDGGARHGGRPGRGPDGEAQLRREGLS